MTSVNRSNSLPVGMRRRARRFRSARRFARAAGVLVCALTSAVAAALAAGAALPVVREAEFLPDLTALVRADGSLALSTRSGDALLTLRLEEPDAALVRQRTRAAAEAGAAPFVARVAEGCPGGLRGPGERADDDDDGLVDEDPLDGRDNDGDGLVDEDFAAVGDAMLTVTRPAAEGGGHVEFYTWAHARLKSTQFLSVRGGDGSRLRLETAGSDWTSMPIARQQHSVTGRNVQGSVLAMVSRVGRDGACGGNELWFGVAVLDPPLPGRIGTARIEGDRLSIVTGNEPVAVALCAAGSWLQLTRMLVDAQRTRDGVADPVTGATTPWVVAPLCPACRTAVAPGFLWRTDRWGGLVLTAVLDKAVALLPDPDLFRVGGVALGSPARIAWRPRDGEVHAVDWSCAAVDPYASAGNPGDPYAALSGVRKHGAAGRLEFRFADPSPALLRALESGGPEDDVQLKGVGIDGRSFAADLDVDVVVEDALQSAVALARGGVDPQEGGADDQQDGLREGSAHPSLSPELLKGWPNPFDDMISLRFEIPQTVGEAFVWNPAGDRPANLDLAAPVPWKNGVPEASVKIYNMSGQHLVTLHTGPVVSGSVTVQWNATDAFGRRVASGSYICKLQLDDWSVSRRLTFVR